MKKQIWVFFLSLTNCFVLHGQYRAEFESPDWATVLPWAGDVDHFFIEDGRLKINRNENGTSELYLPFEPLPAFSVELWISLDFNPSSSNMIRFYLWTEEPLNPNANAIFLELGEPRDRDMLQLIQVKGGKQEVLEVLRYPVLGIKPTFRLKVQFVAPSFWEVMIDCQGKRLFIPGFDTSSMDVTQSLAWFGIFCRYTKTRAGKFYFDDLTMEALKPDTRSPGIRDVHTYRDRVEIEFDEFIMLPAADQILLTHGYDLESLYYDSCRSKLYLFPAKEWESGQRIQVVLNRIRDIYNNAIDTSLSLIVPSYPVQAEIMINEVLFNPSDGLSDYIEVVNRSPAHVLMEGLMIRNHQNNQGVTIDEYWIIGPGEIFVITSDTSAIRRHFPRIKDRFLVFNPLPAFNVDRGNVSLYWDSVELDAMDYDEDMHHPALMNPKGVSLERISLNVSSRDRDNWTSASEVSGFGTPTLPNSVVVLEGLKGVFFETQQRVFSPDGDGYRDRMTIDYALPRPDFTGYVEIYDAHGRWIADLTGITSLGTTGSFVWDGRAGSGETIPEGIYLLVLHAIAPNGATIREGRAIGLTK